jgi:hypothetical protein
MYVKSSLLFRATVTAKDCGGADFDAALYTVTFIRNQLPTFSAEPVIGLDIGAAVGTEAPAGDGLAASEAKSVLSG